MMANLNRITANEARKHCEDTWVFPLNKIYDGVRETVLKCGTCYTFDLSECTHEAAELILKELQHDGYRIVKCAWNPKHYSIFW